MAERPILMSAPMVRAILDGRKTQTRRPVKPQPEWTEPSTWECGDGHHGPGWYVHNEDYRDEGSLFYRCPYGRPGDRLWVRETWFPEVDGNEGPNFPVWYRATDGQNFPYRGPWRPSIYMPRWASRITLEITDVRVQRLQDISEADAFAEGVPDIQQDPITPVSVSARYVCRARFRELWDSTYGQGAWDRDDWVWAVSFKRVVAHG